MRKYGKKGKTQLSVYLNEAQQQFVNKCVEDYGMSKSEVGIRLMFASGTERDPRQYSRR